MPDDPVAIWREAMNDEPHPLNRALWLLFTADQGLRQINPPQAIPLLEKPLKRHKYSAELRAEFQEKIEAARADRKRGIA